VISGSTRGERLRGVFITSTGTGAGKTHVARAIAAGLRARGVRVAALKPIETGCDPDPLDALALERAAGASGFARDARFYRARSPVSPWAASIAGEAPPEFAVLLKRIAAIRDAYEFTLVEGAGGLLVPLSKKEDMASLAAALNYPLLIVAPNRLGVLSHLRTLHESAQRRSLAVLAIVLTEPEPHPDASSSTNARILRELVPAPILSFAHTPDHDEDLARAGEQAGLLAALGF
jgi:dethiobiotin synthetase